MKTTNWFIALIVLCSFIIIGCGTTQVTQDPVTGQTVTNYVSNPAVGTVVGVTTTVAPLLPPPYGTLLGIAGTIATLIAGGIATYQNSQKNKAQTMLASTITGVELGNNPATKTAIQTVMAPTGHAAEFDATVQKVTAAFPKA